jgi:MFS family permease
MAVSFGIWALSTAPSVLCVFALAYGVFYGGWVAVLPAVVTDHFGGRHVGGIIGVLFTGVAFGTLIGPNAAGLAFDISHSYAMPILGSVFANLIAAAIVVGTRKEPFREAASGRPEGGAQRLGCVKINSPVFARKSDSN